MPAEFSTWIIGFATNHDVLIYGLIIILACAEGPILSMLFGVLISLGYFHFLPIYAALMAGDLIGDVVWYYIGYHFAHPFIRRFGKYFGLTEESVARMARAFHKYKHSILFISKISNGLGLALVTLMTAGMVRIPFWKYLGVNALGQLIWSAALIGVGFFFSNLYIQIDNVLGRISIIAVCILFLVAAVRYQRYLRKKADSLDI